MLLFSGKRLILNMKADQVKLKRKGRKFYRKHLQQECTMLGNGCGSFKICFLQLSKNNRTFGHIVSKMSLSINFLAVG